MSPWIALPGLNLQLRQPQPHLPLAVLIYGYGMRSSGKNVKLQLGLIGIALPCDHHSQSLVKFSVKLIGIALPCDHHSQSPVKLSVNLIGIAFPCDHHSLSHVKPQIKGIELPHSLTVQK
jgi:hypothetical protein